MSRQSWQFSIFSVNLEPCMSKQHWNFWLHVQLFQRSGRREKLSSRGHWSQIKMGLKWFLHQLKCNFLQTWCINGICKLRSMHPHWTWLERYSRTRLCFFQDKILQDFAECLRPSDIVFLQTFVASNGWLEKYLNLISTSSRKRCGEHNSINPMQVEKRLHEICKRWLMYHLSALSTLMSWLNSIAQHHQDHTAQSIQIVMVSREAKNKLQWLLELVHQVRNLPHRLLQRALVHVLWRIFQVSVRLLESSMIIKLKPGKIHHLKCTCCTSTTELPRTTVSSSIYSKTTVHLMFVRQKSWIHLDHKKHFSGIRPCA